MTASREIETRIVAGLAAERVTVKRTRRDILIADGEARYLLRLTCYTLPDCWRMAASTAARCPLTGIWQRTGRLMELTAHRVEIGQDAGPHLLALLRNPFHVWPLFSHRHTYPHYAWSTKGQAAHDATRRKERGA